MEKVGNVVVLTNEEYTVLKKAAEGGNPKLPKQKMNTSNKVLLILALFALAFIIVMTVIFCVYQSVPDTLIQCVLGAGGVEAVALSAIKISKILRDKKPIEELTHDGNYDNQ